jgi:flavorubredoxin
MEILIVYGTQFGTTERLARAMGDALATDHAVRILRPREAAAVDGAEVDLVIVGTPTQMHGIRLLVRPFLAALEVRDYRDVAAAAFDTRMPGSLEQTGSAADGIARHLIDAGCRLVRPPEGFVVVGMQGPLADGEEARGVAWARDAALAAAPLTAARR